MKDNFILPVPMQRRNKEIQDAEPITLTRSLRELSSGSMSPQVRHLTNTMNHHLMAITPASTGLMIPTEERAITVAQDGGSVVSESLYGIMGAIRNRLVLLQAGATFIEGLRGDVVFPSYSGSTVNWESEVASAKNGKGTFGKKMMSPKRLTAYVDVSKQLLLQNNQDLEQFIISDFAQAIASKLQATILGNHASMPDRPDGLFTGKIPAMTGPATYRKLALFEAEVNENALNFSYIMNKKASITLKTTLKDPSAESGFIAEKIGQNFECAGYPAFVTNDIPEIQGEQGIIFGNFSELIIGQWGGLDITVDPYTQATDATIRFIVNAYFDAIVRRDDMLTIGTIA